MSNLVYRPGRFEVQIEIGLPDERGRVQILQIHSSKMRENSFLAADINLEEIGESIFYINLNMTFTVTAFLSLWQERRFRKTNKGSLSYLRQ
jgi:SpoVK/Ycf46/Vps4 family AAA+-type ATPase